MPIPYTQLTPETLILRDYLAVDRTVLANQRTFLANIRTALSLVVAGASFVKFSGDVWFEVFGWLLIPLGLLVTVLGVIGFVRTKKSMDALLKMHIGKGKVEGTWTET